MADPSVATAPSREELREELMRCGALAISERTDGCIPKTRALRIREIAHRMCWPEEAESRARPRLGEGDPQQYEISVVVGPCDFSAVEAVTDAMLAAAAPFGLGAVAVTSVYVEEDE